VVGSLAAALSFTIALALVALPVVARAETQAGAPPTDASAPPQPARPGRYAFRPSAMLGLSQWTVFGGGNVAAQLKVRRLTFEYSHGQALHLNRLGPARTEAERDAGVEVELPWTTGGGVGYQITPELHVLIEVKAHRYLVRDTVGETLRYTTFTIGPGVFYDVYLTRNLFLQPSLRWWPTVGSTYSRTDKLMAEDGSAYSHERHDLIPFVNVSLGWTFDGR
jgi:hypothetical protein